MSDYEDEFRVLMKAIEGKSEYEEKLQIFDELVSEISISSFRRGLLLGKADAERDYDDGIDEGFLEGQASRGEMSFDLYRQLPLHVRIHMRMFLGESE